MAAGINDIFLWIEETQSLIQLGGGQRGGISLCSIGSLQQMNFRYITKLMCVSFSVTCKPEASEKTSAAC